jgi:hypothetical protein
MEHVEKALKNHTGNAYLPSNELGAWYEMKWAEVSPRLQLGYTRASFSCLDKTAEAPSSSATWFVFYFSGFFSHVTIAIIHIAGVF